MDGTFRVSNLVLIMLSITDAVARRECRDVIRAPACLCWWPSGEVLKRCSTWRRTRPKRHTARHLAATQRCLPGPHTHTSRDTVLRSQTAGYSLHYSIDVKMFFLHFFDQELIWYRYSSCSSSFLFFFDGSNDMFPNDVTFTFELATCCSQVRRPNHYTTSP